MRTMLRYLQILVSAVAIAALAAAPVMAQMAPAPMPYPAPRAPGAPAPGPESTPKEKQVEGPVKNIDPAAKTVEVGWFLGLFRTTLEVTDDTQIQAEGRKGSLLDIREGAKVKASYESREGKNIAKSIEVLPPEPEKAVGPGGAPARPGSSTGSPAGSPQPMGRSGEQ